MQTDSLRKNFRAQQKAFHRFADKAARNPSPDHVHQLRVSNRRLRAILALVIKDPRFRHFRALKSSLRELGKVLGSQRELDVVIGDAAEFGLPVASLKKRIKSRKKKVKKFLSPSRRGALLGCFSQLDEELKFPVLMEKKPLTKLLKKVRAWRRRKLAPKNLHRFRIAIKKMRYILEALDRPVGPLKEIQGYLGRAHDLEVLQEILGKNKITRKAENRAVKKAKEMAPSALAFARNQLRSLL
jgi:CHAD domain-containing protein